MQPWAQMLCPLPWLLKHISKFSGGNIILMSSEQYAASTAELRNFQEVVPYKTPSQPPGHRGDVTQTGCLTHAAFVLLSNARL